MFEIGWSELLLIAVVAIVVIGPKELPGVLRGLGKTLNKFRRSADDFRRQFEDSVRDSGFEDIQRDIRAVSDMNPATQIRNSINETLRAPAPPSDTPLSPSAYEASLEQKPSQLPSSELEKGAGNMAANADAPREEKPELPRAHTASA
ncbi:MAG: Sec-independent protein translocase protein TatB [Hyphomicrobiales bacterium]|nr:Sec-independent protein translocase protein TatB [Hyphomicrobiales bacterium]